MYVLKFRQNWAVPASRRASLLELPWSTQRYVHQIKNGLAPSAKMLDRYPWKLFSMCKSHKKLSVKCNCDVPCVWNPLASVCCQILLISEWLIELVSVPLPSYQRIHPLKKYFFHHELKSRKLQTTLSKVAFLTSSNCLYINHVHLYQKGLVNNCYNGFRNS